MQIYPFNGPIILTDAIFAEYGGLGTGSFTAAQLRSSYWLAEMQVTSYIGAPLLPATVTGTYPYTGQQRISTDYGYVQELLALYLISQNEFAASATLKSSKGAAFIYVDTFGYVDIHQIMNAANAGYLGYWGVPVPNFPPTYPNVYNYTDPYQFQLAYRAGLPTGTANQPGILEALTLLAQIDLNEKQPGLVDMNEGPGDIAIQSYRSLDYSENRGAHSLVKTALGESPKAMRAKRLIDMSITKARKSLRIG